MKKLLILLFLFGNFAGFGQTTKYIWREAGGKYHQKKYNEAIKDLNLAIQLEPNFEKLYNTKGACNHELEKYDEAIANYSIAIKLKPTYYAAIYNRAKSYLNNNFTEAIEDYTKVISKCKNDYEAYTWRGYCFNELGKYNEAILDFDKAINIKKKYSDAYYYRAIAKNKLNDKIGACADWKKALELGYKEAQKMLDENCK